MTVQLEYLIAVYINVWAIFYVISQYVYIAFCNLFI